jgi:hypothetical protein
VAAVESSEVSELLVIVDVSDPLVDALASAARTAAGMSVSVLDWATAARLLEIRRRGGDVDVMPAASMLLRPSRTPGPWEDGETLFHRGEMVSAVWAAAALTAAPVVNRPGPQGLVGHCAATVSASRARANIPPEPETFTSHRPEPDGPPAEWWVEPQRFGRQMPWTVEASRAGGPYRAARVTPGFELSRAVVVGDETFGAEPGSALDVRSRQASAALGLAFATVTWRTYRTAEPVFVAINPFPVLEELDGYEDIVIAALLRILRQ